MGFLPDKDRDYLVGKNFAYEEITEMTPNGTSINGIIIKNFPLPKGKFDAESANVLIIIPPHYPDCPPDMFHLLPWVRLVNKNSYPNRANVAVNFNGQSWQRWSRHNPEWRRGKDSIKTMLQRVICAIEEAA